ncbi:hypothetical protein HDU96_003134, partial [Phlyctochytrium bullatum]
PTIQGAPGAELQAKRFEKNSAFRSHLGGEVDTNHVWEDTSFVPPTLASISQAPSRWGGSINPNDILNPQLIVSNSNCTVEKGVYQSLGVIVKRSVTKHLSKREIDFHRRASDRDYIVRFRGWYEEVDVGIAGLVMQKSAMDLRDRSRQAARATDLDDKMLHISECISKGMALINNLDIIHNDLKPQNVFVDKYYDKPYFGDFGGATNRGEPLLGYTHIQSVESLGEHVSVSAQLASVPPTPPIEELNQLWDAVANNNISALNSTLSANLLDVNATKDGLSVLQFACVKNLVDVVKTLLYFGADPQQKDANGWLPIPLSTSVAVWRALSAKMPAPHGDLFDLQRTKTTLALVLSWRQEGIHM